MGLWEGELCSNYHSAILSPTATTILLKAELPISLGIWLHLLTKALENSRSVAPRFSSLALNDFRFVAALGWLLSHPVHSPAFSVLPGVPGG